MEERGIRDDDCSSVELELYFLIAKFLSSGPCKKAAEALQSELQEHKLLPKRVDWEGGKHFRSFDSLNESLPHISATHLMQICQRIGPILDRELPPNVKGVSSLLGAGRQSLLRTKQGVEKTIWKGPTYCVRRHGRPLMPPNNMIASPNIVNLISGHQMSGGLRIPHVKSNSLYSKFTPLTRALGHLSAVYCVAFDRTGQFIFTGADDKLIKLWSASTGRLLTTLRGHAAEITDMAINYENTMLATGSCDKQIRVWCLRNMSPIAVLQAHTGMITSLQFSPMVRKESRYLMSTGGDGCVCFWQWNVNTQKFNPKPIKFIERSRAGAQMLCSSFSPGGIFLATGSADQVIRVYCFIGVYPEKICELEAHTDQVDSIQYANNCDKFVSGSKDGTARLWRYERQSWKAILLNMGQQMPSDGSRTGSVDEKRKYAVTMIEWTKDDAHIITAVNDNSLKVWDSNTGQLVNILKGHQNEVFVLENNPVDPRILLSAGHDGHIILWDLPRAVQIFDNFNTISGQGHGAVFDCKWAPDGLRFATTDSHGFVRLLGLGSSEKFKILPEEYFFHTDYRPLIRDQHGYVVDEQTQQAPHLMPPPFLVDIDGNPHPPHLQRLVPGRENCGQNQLIPQIGITPSGDREVLDNSIADAPISNNEQQQEAAVRNADEVVAGPAEPRAEPAQADEAGPTSSADGPDRQPQDLDSLIARMQRDMDRRAARRSVEEPPFSPPPHDAQHQADGAVRVISVVPGARRNGTGACAADKKKQTASVVPPLEHSVVRQSEENRLALADTEIKYYQAERKKRPPMLRHDSTDSGSVGGQRHTRQQRRRPNSRRSRQARNEETGRNRLTTRALYDTDVEEDAMDEENEPRRERDHSDDEEEVEEEEEDAEEHSDNDEEEDVAANSDDHMWNSDKSDSDSSDYSDWTPVGERNMAPPKRRSQRQIKRKRFASFTDEENVESDTTEDEDKDDDNDDQEEGEENEEQETEQEKPQRRQQPRRKKPKEKRRRPPPKKRRPARNRPRAQQVIGNTANVGEVPEEFKPPDWLTETIPHKAPYYPQIGDEIMYFRQGHENYVRMCKHRRAYDINPKKNQPWHKTDLREQELVKVVGIKYEIKPPRLVCLKLAMIDPVTSKSTGASFSVKYHDMPDVIDFLVLRQTYNTALQRKWKVNDRFRSIIDKAWWCGSITGQEPYQAEYPDSLFQCYNVQWDNGETERMSPWDFEPLLPENEPDERGASVPVQMEEIKEVLYFPQDGEWPERGMDSECERVIKGLEQVMELSVAENFIAPVDLNAYPDYAMMIEYPIDLSTIKARLENRFYRRTAAVMYDVRLIEGNTKKFNRPGSRITKCGTLITELLLRFIRDTDTVDVMPMYSELAKDSDFAVAHTAGPDERPGTSRSRSFSGPGSGTRRSSSAYDPNSWKEECQNLTQDLLESEDSVPFRQPVDPVEVPDYFDIVESAMDLTTVMSKIEGDIYMTPSEFADDIRLIFANSKAYNTNKRSRIYTMTLRLSAKFEERMNDIMEMWKKAKRYGKSAPNARRKSSTRTSFDGPSMTSPRAGTSRPNAVGSSAASSASATSPPGQNSQTGASSHSRRRVGSSAVMTVNSRSRDASAAASGASSSRSSPPTITRSGRAVKRKKIESDSDATEIDSDAEKKNRKPPPAKRSSRTSQLNGHSSSSSRYSTRNRAGSNKRKRYDDDSSAEEESEEDHTPKGKGKGKSSKGRRVTSTRSSPRKVRNGHRYREDEEEEESDSDSESNSNSSEDEDSDVPRKTCRTRDRKSSSRRNMRNGRSKKQDSSDDESTAESTSASDKSEDDNDSDSNDEEDKKRDSESNSDSDGSVVKRKRTTRTARSNGVTSRRASQRPKRSPVLLDQSVASQRGKRNTRNQGRRTVCYDEDSEEEAQIVKEAEEGTEDSEATDDYSDIESSRTTVSSRGRVRKKSAKALGVS